MKFKLILITVVAFGSMGLAQSKLDNLSIGVGIQGILPASTVDKASYRSGAGNSPAAQSTTDSAGVLIDARYDFGRHSAVGAAITISRASELFWDDTGAPSRIKNNNEEIIGTYIFRLPYNEFVKPYAMFGGGMVRFAPVSGYSANGTPETQMKAAFAYGFGTDIRVAEHWALRMQYRGLLRKEANFKLATTSGNGNSGSNSGTGFGTGLKTHVPEPSISIVYHF